MRVLILTFGTRGDVQPYVALASGLIQAGHVADICTHRIHRPFIEEFGVGFVNFPGSNPQEMFDYCVVHGIFSIKFMREISNLAFDFMSGWATILDQNIGKYDLIVATFTSCYSGVSIAEGSKVPVCIVHYLPIGETSYYYSPFAPQFLQWSTSHPSYINYLSHEVIEYLYGQLARVPTNAMRAKHKLPSINGFHRSSNWAAKTTAPKLYCYSPSFLPVPPDWDDTHRVCGYFWLPEKPYTPFSELKDFLEAGPPPVYVGFGSVTVPGHDTLLPKLLRAIRNAHCRALVFTNETVDPSLRGEDIMISNAAVPHSWLFPRMALIVHHGGAGTVAYAMRAGVPSIIMPFFGDHFLWSNRLYDIGCGPLPVIPKQADAEKLTQLITDTLNDAQMHARLKKLSEKILAEDSVGKAVRYLEHIQRDGCLPPLSPSARSPISPAFPLRLEGTLLERRLISGGGFAFALFEYAYNCVYSGVFAVMNVAYHAKIMGVQGVARWVVAQARAYVPLVGQLLPAPTSNQFNQKLQ